LEKIRIPPSIGPPGVIFWKRSNSMTEAQMGCQKGQEPTKAKPGEFQCKKCGAVAAKKKKLCKPKKSR